MIPFPIVFKLSRNKKIREFKYLHKLWTMEFDIIPRGLRPGWTNIILATNSGNEHSSGARIPAVFFKDMSTILHICAPEIFPHEYMCHNFDAHPLKLNKRSKIRIQFIPGFPGYGQQNQYRIYINNELVHNAIPRYMTMYNHVKVRKSFVTI